MKLEKLTKLVVLMGQTGAGKTALGIALAKEFDGEVINADSRQIYVGMDVGTDKATLQSRPGVSGDPARVSGDPARVSGDDSVRRRLRDAPVLIEGVPHYLIDILTPDQEYSAAAFRDDARRIIADIRRRGKLPIVVGGTGFYLRVLTGELELPGVPPDPAFRAWAAKQSVEALAEELRRRAPALYQKVDNPKNRRRVTRYLEVARGEAARPQLSTLHSQLSTSVLKLALVPPRDELRARIAARVDDMFRRGFVDEVRRLVRRYGEAALGLQTTGYREILRGFREGWTEEQMKSAVFRSHWETARRQLTWLKREPDLTSARNAAEARERVNAFLRSP